MLVQSVECITSREERVDENKMALMYPNTWTQQNGISQHPNQTWVETCKTLPKKAILFRHFHEYLGISHQDLGKQCQIYYILKTANTPVVAGVYDFLWSSITPLDVLKNFSTHLRELLQSFFPSFLSFFFTPNLPSVYYELHAGRWGLICHKSLINSFHKYISARLQCGSLWSGQDAMVCKIKKNRIRSEPWVLCGRQMNKHRTTIHWDKWNEWTERQGQLHAGWIWFKLRMPGPAISL